MLEDCYLFAMQCACHYTQGDSSNIKKIAILNSILWIKESF